jgi:uncharacterized membrane protein YfcA
MTLEIAVFVTALAGAGLLAGFIGGLFGVGGGVVIVPALVVLLAALGVEQDVRIHVAVATSLSTIIATSWRSLSAHAKANAVDVDILKAWAPWIALGAVIGAVIAGFVDGTTLMLVFGVGLLLVSANMAFGSDRWRLSEHMPQGFVRRGLASGVGILSAMMGIGGGAFGVTLMTLCGRPIHRAVATASGFGAAIAVPGALINIVTGWGQAGLPWGSLGYVNVPGFVLLGLLTGFTAPFGARLAHRLDRRKLSLAFAVFLGITAIGMLVDALGAD